MGISRNKRYSLFFFLLFQFFQAKAEFLDPTFYLVDSLDQTSLLDSELPFLKNQLKKYHDETIDSNRLKILCKILSKSNHRSFDSYYHFTMKKLEKHLTVSSASHTYFKIQAFCLYMKAIQKRDQGDVFLALDLNAKALALREKIAYDKGIAQSLNFFASVYRAQEDYLKALEYYTLSQKIYQKKGDIKGYAVTLINKIAIYLINDDFVKAKRLLDQVLEITLKEKFHIMHLSALTNYGNLYYKEGKLEQSAKKFKEVLQLCKQKKVYNHSMLNALSGLCDIYKKTNDYKNLRARAFQLLEQAQIQKNIEYVSSANLHLYYLKKKQNNYKTALAYFENYIELNDSTHNKAVEQAVFKQQLSYEYEKAKQIRALKHQQEVSLLEEKKKRQTLISVFSFFGLITSMVLLYFIYKQLKQTEKQKKAILIEKESEEIKALLSQMNPHFISNALMHLKDWISHSNQSIKQIEDYLTKFSRLTRHVLEYSFKKTISLEKEIELVKDYLDLEQVRTQNKFEYTIDIDPCIDLDFIELPPMFFQPILENAIWHGIVPSPKKGEIYFTIVMNSVENQLIIHIKDNGVGIKSHPPKKENASLSHKIIQKRLRLLWQNKFTQDFFETHSVEHQGTQVKIILPI